VEKCEIWPQISTLFVFESPSFETEQHVRTLEQTYRCNDDWLKSGTVGATQLEKWSRWNPLPAEKWAERNRWITI